MIDTEEHTAQLYSTLLDADDVYEIVRCFNIRMAVPPNQRIIILNKGMGSKGFSICCDCDAAMHADDPVVLKDICVHIIPDLIKRSVGMGKPITLEQPGIIG